MRLIDADALSKKLIQTTIFIKDGEVFQRMINDAPTVSAEAIHKPDYSYEADMVRRLKEALSADRKQKHTLPDGSEIDIDEESYEIGYTEGQMADRPTGEWLVGDAFPHNVYCSNCYATFAQEHWEVWEDGRLPRNFCPNCGAKMGGGNR